MPYFFNNGLSLHYADVGDGMPTVLLHGGAVNYQRNFATAGWEATLTGASLRLLGLDLRGHGLSDKPADPNAYGSAPLASDVIALLDHLNIERANLVGYSMGSAVSLRLLCEHPQRIERAALIAAGDRFMADTPHDNIDILSAIADALMSKDYPSHLPKHLAAYWTLVTQTGGHPAAVALAFRGAMPPMPRNHVSQVQVPVLVVSGSDDRVLGSAREIATTLADARHLEIGGGTHFSLASDTGVQNAVIDFLCRTPHRKGKD